MTPAALTLVLALAFGAASAAEPTPPTDPGLAPAPDEAAPAVTLWDGTHPGWIVTGVEPDGLHVERSGRPDVIGWHRVRAVSGVAAAEAAPFLELGKAAWRAIGRLDRGDAFGAEPLFESLFERYRGVPGPTSAVVAEGLMRCRLRRDARAAALSAWLSLYENLAGSPASRPRWGLDSPAIDPDTLLAPALPPLWLDDRAARAFAEMPATGTGGGVAWAMRVLYRAAARYAAGYPIDADDLGRAGTIAERREGGALVSAMVAAQVGGVEARADARRALERERRPGGPAWRREWAAIAIGRSLLREENERDRLRGVLELLSLHTDPRGATPYLHGIALADAVVGCRGLGDEHAAGVLENELRRLMPTHPALSTPAFQGPGASARGGIERISTP